MLTMIRGTLRTLLVAAALTVVAVQGVDAATTSFSHTIYRGTAFSTQATDYWCTAAVVQNIVNLATGRSSHSSTQQKAYYAYGRAHNRYAYRARGVDPQGLEAMLERYMPGSDWRQIRKKTLAGVLRSSARRMRATGLPAILFVSGGKHVWTMNGYRATADPASGRWFSVTHVRFSGPLYPRQKARLGWFDLTPNTERPASRLPAALFPYREYLAFGDHRSTPWNGWYVAVVPMLVGDGEPAPTPDPTPVPTPDPTPDATPEPAPSGTPNPTPEATNAPDALAEPSPTATVDPAPTAPEVAAPTPGDVAEPSVPPPETAAPGPGT